MIQQCTRFNRPERSAVLAMGSAQGIKVCPQIRTRRLRRIILQQGSSQQCLSSQKLCPRADLHQRHRRCPGSALLQQGKPLVTPGSICATAPCVNNLLQVAMGLLVMFKLYVQPCQHQPHIRLITLSSAQQLLKLAIGSLILTRIQQQIPQMHFLPGHGAEQLGRCSMASGIRQDPGIKQHLVCRPMQRRRQNAQRRFAVTEVIQQAPAQPGKLHIILTLRLLHALQLLQRTLQIIKLRGAAIHSPDQQTGQTTARPGGM